MTVCWNCHRPHTGGVWCPHCSAPVDPGSSQARSSIYWARHLDRAHAVVLEMRSTIAELGRIADDVARLPAWRRMTRWVRDSAVNDLYRAQRRCEHALYGDREPRPITPSPGKRQT